MKPKLMLDSKPQEERGGDCGDWVEQPGRPPSRWEFGFYSMQPVLRRDLSRG